MIVYPCSKINLGLNITERRTDGYHNIETVFYPIPLHDNLEVISARNATQPYLLHQTGPYDSVQPAQNLIIRVYEQLRADYPQIPPVEIWLHKRIPTGGGLGGGSSDAAYMMRLLNEQYRLEMDEEDITYRLSKLGADCAFFYHPRPTFATGIGNQLTPIDLNLGGWHLILVKPPTHISTKEAYADVRPRAAAEDLRLSLVRPVETWRDTIKNDFEESIFIKHPEISAIKRTLYDMGAAYASLSGSGASVYALFRHQQPEAKEVFKNCFVAEMRLRFNEMSYIDT